MFVLFLNAGSTAGKWPEKYQHLLYKWKFVTLVRIHFGYARVRGSCLNSLIILTDVVTTLLLKVCLMFCIFFLVGKQMWYSYNTKQLQSDTVCYKSVDISLWWVGRPNSHSVIYNMKKWNFSRDMKVCTNVQNTHTAFLNQGLVQLSFVSLKSCNLKQSNMFWGSCCSGIFWILGSDQKYYLNLLSKLKLISC